MKAVKTVLIALLFGLCAGRTYALEPKTHTFFMAPDISYIQYEETGVKETGLMYGINGSYTYRGPLFETKLEKTVLMLEGHMSYGEIEYDGHLTDGTPKKINDVEDFMLEIRGLAGYDFPLFTATTLTPYVGLGYRFLKDDLSKDFAGYRREANYIYSPLGLETNTKLNARWSWGVRFEYDLFWSGEQNSYLSDVDVSLADVSNDQDNGWGMKAALKIKNEREAMNILFEPYVNYWSIDRSNTSPLVLFGAIVGSTVEPENTSLEYGLKLGVEY